MNDVVDITQGLAVVAACWAVISGVDAWKREFIGKRQIELAEEVLSRFFELRDAIAFIRSPFSSESEGKSRAKDPSEGREVELILNRAFIVYERYGKREATFNAFRSLKYRFMANFGSQHEYIFSGVDRQLNSVFVAAQMLGLHYWQRQGRVEMTPEERKEHLSQMWEQEQIFWDHGKDDDPVRTELSKLQQDLEKVVLPCFTESMQTYSVLTKRFWLVKLGRVGNG